jgi:hypothetical protein
MLSVGRSALSCRLGVPEPVQIAGDRFIQKGWTYNRFLGPSFVRGGPNSGVGRRCVERRWKRYGQQRRQKQKNYEPLQSRFPYPQGAVQIGSHIFPREDTKIEHAASFLDHPQSTCKKERYFRSTGMLFFSCSVSWPCIWAFFWS